MTMFYPFAAIAYPNIDPVFFSIGPFPIRWYALAYIAGISLGWFYVAKLISKPKLWSDKAGAPVSKEHLDDIVFWVALGVILGGRLGYVLFYEPGLLGAPWESLGAPLKAGLLKTLIGWIHIPPALMLWKGGMSFHGGLIGVTLAGFFYSRRHKLNALSVGDLFACAAPIGLFFGRIANFINAELYGRPWDGPWAMQFPYVNQYGEMALTSARHPSQLYEAALEGIFLFLIMFFATHRLGLLKRPGALIGIFLSGYAASRIFVENFREPDAHMPDFPLGLTMGMMLSLPMLGLGIWMVWRTQTVKMKRANDA